MTDSFFSFSFPVLYLIPHVKTNASYHQDYFLFFMIFLYSFIHRYVLCFFSQAGNPALGAKDTARKETVPPHQGRAGWRDRHSWK